ncbi:hypothetical protein EMIT0P201_70111 [Pseudomonas chlororaphis]
MRRPTSSCSSKGIHRPSPTASRTAVPAVARPPGRSTANFARTCRATSRTRNTPRAGAMVFANARPCWKTRIAMTIGSVTGTNANAPGKKKKTATPREPIARSKSFSDMARNQKAATMAQTFITGKFP